MTPSPFENRGTGLTCLGRKAMMAMLGVVLVALVWKLGGAVGLAYAGLLLLATLPGVPLGLRLFGSRHPAGWLTGMIAGYALSSLVIWTATALRPSSNVPLVIGWACVTATTWILLRRARSRIPWLAPPPWTKRDRLALVMTLFLVPAIVGPPFARILARDSHGNQRIHAYFTADFVWHMAVVAELQKGALPPRDPFLASQPLHYYWTYFLVPASGARMAGASPQLALEITAIGASLALVAAIFLAAWAAWPRHPFAVAAATAFTIIASSAEGLAALAYVFHMSGSIAGVRDLNVDALSRGLGGLRIDDLPRAMWYTPQHGLSYAPGLVTLPIAIWGGARARPAAILAAGTLLAISVMLNPFVGGVFCVIYGGGVIMNALAISRLQSVLKHALAIAPVVAGLAWVAANGMIEGAGGILRLGFVEPASNAPVTSFILSFGPLLVLMVAGIWPHRLRSLETVAPAALGIAIGIVLMHLLVLSVDLFWVGFRTGHLILVLAPALLARAFLILHDRGRLLATTGIAAVLCVIGIPTTVIDVFNARDIDNDHMGPGFHWTVILTPEEQEALAWIRAHTPPTAIVQAEPVVRGRETWSLIPTYAERRMVAGLPISLMHVSDYDTKSARVRQIYGMEDAASAWQLARALGIDFLYVDRTERRAYPDSAKFLNHPEYFTPAFINREVVVVAVKTPMAPVDPVSAK